MPFPALGVVLLVWVPLVAWAGGSPCAPGFAGFAGAPPSIEIILATQRRLYEELRDPVLRQKHLNELGRTLVAHGWSTPEVLERLARQAQELETGEKPAQPATLEEAMDRNIARRIPAVKSELRLFTPDGRWLIFEKTSDRLARLDLRTGQETDLGEWPKLLGISPALVDGGKWLAVPEQGTGGIRFHRARNGLVAPAAEFTLGEAPPRGLLNRLFRSPPQPHFIAHIWPMDPSHRVIVGSHNTSGPVVYRLFDLKKKTVVPIPLDGVKGNGRIQSFAVVPGTDRMGFMLRSGSEDRPLYRAVSFRVAEDGKLVEPIIGGDWQAQSNVMAPEMFWGPGGRTVYLLDANAGAGGVLRRYGPGTGREGELVDPPQSLLPAATGNRRFFNKIYAVVPHPDGERVGVGYSRSTSNSRVESPLLWYSPAEGSWQRANGGMQSGDSLRLSPDGKTFVDNVEDGLRVMPAD